MMARLRSVAILFCCRTAGPLAEGQLFASLPATPSTFIPAAVEGTLYNFQLGSILGRLSEAKHVCILGSRKGNKGRFE